MVCQDAISSPRTGRTTGVFRVHDGKEKVVCGLGHYLVLNLFGHCGPQGNRGLVFRVVWAFWSLVD